jgi:exonuclease III
MTQNQSTKQETALDWFIEKIGYQKDGEWYIGIREDINIQHWVDQVRQMEKEQHKNTWFDSTLQFDNSAGIVFTSGFEQYYNETYGKTNSNTGID